MVDAATLELVGLDMSASLFSQSWYLVKDLKVRLRAHTQVHRHVYRDQVWYVLQDKVTGQYHRFSVESWHIIGLLNGERSVDEVWELACQQLGDDMPAQDEIITLLSSLFQANVLVSDRVPDLAELSTRKQSISRRKMMQKLASPLGIRIPMWDPEPFLQRTAGVARAVISPLGLLVWLLVTLSGLVMATVHWPELTGNLSDRVLSVENMLLMVLVYPVVKFFHEMGHAWTVKRWGGEVHEMGIMLLVFFPVPYVEASASNAFASKYQRMLVGAAGILVELFIAGLSMIVWTLLEPGIARSVAFNTMVLAGVSTVLFNGNPLLRFDAYYVLADWLEIPNLAGRANQQFIYLVKRYLLRIPRQLPVARSRWEASWMLGYAVVSFIYRLFVMVLIALFVASKYLFIGALLAIWSIWMSLLSPLLKALWAPFTQSDVGQRRHQVLLIGGVLLSLITGLVALVPMPYSTQTEGVFIAPENTWLLPEAQGFIADVLVDDGAEVVRGQPILRLTSPELEADYAVVAALLKEAEAEYQASLSAQASRADANIYRDLMALRQQEFDRISIQREALTVLSPNDGQLKFLNPDDLAGRFVHRGQLLGHVLKPDRLPVVAVVGHDAIDDVRQRTENVEARLSSQVGEVVPALIEGIVPEASQALPSPVLTTEGGGLLAPDSSASAASGQPRSFRRVFQVRLAIANPVSDPGSMIQQRHLNERVYVLFRHPDEALMYRWFRSVRRMFLRQLDV
ncbi:MAG: peptidase M50 [Oceanobacter sp.]